MTTLADFLLARIAEDEAALRGPEVFIKSGGQPQSFDALPRPRLLAECEAKRRIVNVSTTDIAASQSAKGAWHMHAEMVRRLLALPYADHPDYRQEWKP